MKSGEDADFIKKHIKEYMMIEKVVNRAKNYNVQQVPVPESFARMVRSLDLAYYTYCYTRFGKQLTKK